MDTRPILLVEDNESDVELTRRAFEKNHIANLLVVREDGQDALDYLFGPAGSGPAGPLPALILLDLKLPKISGLEVLRRIRADERTRRIPVVILTSSKEEQDMRSGYDLGVNSYIRKSVNFDEFLAAVAQIGLYWLVINEPPPDSGAEEVLP